MTPEEFQAQVAVEMGYPADAEKPRLLEWIQELRLRAGALSFAQAGEKQYRERVRLLGAEMARVQRKLHRCRQALKQAQSTEAAAAQLCCVGTGAPFGRNKRCPNHGEAACGRTAQDLVRELYDERVRNMKEQSAEVAR